MKELDPEIIEQLETSLSSTMLDKISPSETSLQKVLTLVGTDLSSIPDKELSAYIYTLAQYQVFLQAQYNSRHIKFLESERAYNINITKELSLQKDKRTVKEKTSELLLNNTQLQDLEKDMRIKRADFLLFEKIPEAISELTNALKKELSIRHQKDFTRY